MDPRNRRLLFATLLLAALPAVALSAARPHTAARRQRPATLRLQPVLDKLGLKLVGAPTAELKLGQRVRAVVADPGKLASAGLRGVRAGAVLTVEAVKSGSALPGAASGDAAAAEKTGQQSRAAAQAAAAGLSAKVTTGDAGAGNKGEKSIIYTPAPAGTGIPTSTID